MKKILLIITIAMLGSIAGYSQAPGIFNYQGVARNSVGNVLINQNITLRLTIHDLTAGGATVYQESRNVVTNPFGLFNVQVGSAGATNVTGTVAGVNWAVGNKFIQVEIDPAGGTTFINIGTAQLASVPYSLFATTAGDFVLPFSKTQASATTLFSIINTGTGGSGSFSINNAASTVNALTGTTNGTGNGVLGVHSATTGTAAGVRGESNSQDGNAVGTLGIITSTTPGGFSAGVRGTNNGTGGLGIGVYGSQAGSGWGVYGTTPTGIGVHGNSPAGFGLYGLSTSGVGVYGLSTDGQPAVFDITNNANNNNTVTANSNGGGNAISGINTGTGRGGFFQVNNAASVANAIEATTNGTGASWGIRATSTGTNGAGLFIINNAASTANNVQSNNNGLGRAGFFQNTSATNTANAVEATNAGTGRAFLGRRGAGSGVALGQTEAIRGDNTDGPGVAGTANTAVGIYGTSVTTHGVWGVGVVANAAGVEGRNDVVNGFGVEGISLGGGIGVHGTSQTGHASSFDITNAASTGDGVRSTQNGLGRGVYSLINNTSNIVAAVRGETNGGGYGVFGQATGNGNAGFFQISNPASTSSTVNVTTNGIGGGVTVQLTNASNGARGLDVLQAGVGPGVFATSAGGNAVWGITSSISAAGVIGDNTFGEAVVGRNRGGIGVGAVVGRNDSSGYGVRGFNAGANSPGLGIAVLGQSGISGNTGTAGRFENVNSLNGTSVLQAAGNGTGASLVVSNSNAGVVDLAIFRKNAGNVARIDDAGKVFANGGFQASGADVAEYFSVEGLRNSYEPGDVLVISQNSDRTVEKSSTPYSTLVSGVYATKPGITLSEENINNNLDAKVPMGVIGVIPTKVCLEGGAIKRGDLLVTSSITGVAMKADPDKVRVGQVLGKALQDYNGNEVGIINVLVSVK